MLALQKKTAVVTGASRGIGRGIAAQLAEAGASRLAITYFKDEAAAARTVAALEDRGAEAFALRYDQSRPEDTERLFRSVRERFGALDVFVSNARADYDRFFESPERIALDRFEYAFASQSRAFHLEVRHAAELLGDGGASSPSPTRPAGAPAAGSRGSRWARPRRRSRAWCATGPWRSPRAASPSTRSARV
jgi:NAD(P)-dependent dehydrogenase (short-subunit alcohol dehydrogenase family)